MSQSPNVSFAPADTERERAETPRACCYSWYEHCPGGRPLRADGRLVGAAAVRREDWAGPTAPLGPLDSATRERLGGYWAEANRAED